MSTSDPDAQDRTDIQRLVAGDDGALNELIRRHGPTVHRLLLGLLNDPQDALDLAQETFVRVYQARHRFRTRDRFVPWLLTIATNLARNRLRWRQRHPTVPIETRSGDATDPAASSPALISNEPSPGERLLAQERLEAVRAAVAGLPAELREAVVLCEWEELSQAQAAAVLGTSAKAVESRLYRARQRLRSQLQHWL